MTPPASASRGRRAVAATVLATFLSLILVVPVQNAYAAQDSTVIAENAAIRVEPKKTSKALEYLPLGSEVRISSYPMPGGWYKIRAKNGVYGWIHETEL